MKKSWTRYLSLAREAWKGRDQLTSARRTNEELDFLPAALQIQERPPSPAGRILGYSLITLTVIAIAWASVGEVDVVAVAEGKIISSSRIKEIQPLEKGVLKAILVKEGESVKQGQALAVKQELIENQQDLASEQAREKQFLAAIDTVEQQYRSIQAETLKISLTEADDIQRQNNTLMRELEKASDLNDKQILYAPVDGTVQQLAVHPVGGVVTEAQILMKLVPKEDHLEVEAILENKDIGFVFEGQKSEVKINTFNFTKYGVIGAEVIDVTADAIFDEARGLVYSFRLKLEENKINVGDRVVDLIPGMTVTAEIKTGRRKLIEYILSPLLRKLNESITER